MNAPKVKVVAVDAFEQPFRLRLPFRFGAVTVTGGRQAIVRLRLKLDDGREGDGFAAEALGAKWFDKNPDLSDEQNLHQLRRALELCRDAYLAAPPLTAFALHAEHHRALLDAGSSEGLLPLVASFGPALLDRALLDALARLEGLGFDEAMRANRAGMTPHAIAPDLAHLDVGAFLRSLPSPPSIHARHTVGLVDPIVASDQPPGTRVDDGLPETLDEVVAAYGHRYFKLKVAGRLDADLDRLTRIASVLDRIERPIAVTLDGNEQYEQVDAVVELWRQMTGTPALRRLCAATLFIEQPIKRQAAFDARVDALAAHRPVIIDESDGDLDAFPRARALGYAGVSSKACKGFYKSLLNLARCRRWNGDGPPRYFLSGEDLTTQAGLSVQQDLALVGLLGLEHVERNGHHFVDGFGDRPAAEAEAFLRAHPDLYRRDRGRVRLAIRDGRLALGSLKTPGFGCSLSPELRDTPPMPRADWPHGTNGRTPR